MELKNIIADIIAAAQEENKKLGKHIPAINMVCKYTACQSGSRQYYRFEFAGKTYESETTYFGEVRDFARCIEIAVDKLKEKRGCKAVCHRTTVYEQVYDHVWRSMRNEPVEITDGIILYSEPTKEFKSLARWIEKFSGVKLDNFTLYGVEVSGKRGRIYGEDGDRRYDCYNAAKCRRILDWIIKNKSSRDTLKVEVKTKDEVPDRDISIRLETECYGTRFSYLEMEVLTPKGNKKASTDTIYI